MLTYLQFIAFRNQDVVKSLITILHANHVVDDDYSYIEHIVSQTTSPSGYLVIKDPRAIGALSYFAVNYHEQNVGRTIAIARYLITKEVIDLVVHNHLPWVIDGLHKLVSLAVSIFGSDLNTLRDIAAPLDTVAQPRPLLLIKDRDSSATIDDSPAETDAAATRLKP